MAVGVADWLPVADSEDEDIFAQFISENGTKASGVTSPDVIQTAFFTPDNPRTPPRGQSSGESFFTPPPAGTDLTISNFTSVPSTSVVPSEMGPKPRPRPRPTVVMKKAATSNPNTNAASTSFSHISDPATTRTSDSIHPATAMSFGFSNVIEDAYSSLDIAERAKMRSRKSQTAKSSKRAPIQIDDVIELTSDEDELTLKPTKRQKKQADPVPKPGAQTKPRPKPRRKVRPGVVLPSGSPSNPIVARDHPELPPQYGLSSQLPPSTLPTIPPSTPPQARELTPLSSPPVTNQKRKRIRPLIADDDEMDIICGNPTEASPSTVPPPFFAPSSSSVPTDSGIEIPPVESLSSRSKKKQVPSGEKRTQKKAWNKERKGKKGEMASTVDQIGEVSAGITQEPSTPATCHGPSVSEGRHSPVVGDPAATEMTSEKQTVAKKGKARAVDPCEEDDELVLPLKSITTRTPTVDGEEGQRSKENLQPISSPKRDLPPKHSSPSLQVRESSVKPKLTPMSELIRRVNSQPSSPFPSASRTYSPMLKSSRTMLSRIAPLHPNRRTPPPPLPRPPPPKKSKKQLEMEERINEELAETVDGWSCLTDDERKALRKARIDAELGYED